MVEVMRIWRSSLISGLESTAICGRLRRRKRASSGRSAWLTSSTGGALSISALQRLPRLLQQAVGKARFETTAALQRL